MRKPARRARNPEATKEALLQAATELFALRGYDGVRLDDLAERASVNKALVSYYFGGKRKLYRAAIESSFRELEHLAELLSDPSRPPMELARGFVSGFAELATKKRPHFPALFLRETLATGGLAPEAVEHARAIVGRFQDMLDRGIADGSFREVDVMEVYLHLVGSLAFFFATDPARRRTLSKPRAPLSLPSPESYTAFVSDALERLLSREPELGATA